MLSQTSLLGIWGSLGTSPWWKRLIGVVVGISYLVPVLGIGMDESVLITFILVVAVTSFVAIPLLIVRLFRIAIRLDDSPVASVGRIQFSIRHLMILTFVIACLISIGKLVQTHALRTVRSSICFLITLAFGCRRHPSRVVCPGNEMAVLIFSIGVGGGGSLCRLTAWVWGIAEQKYFR